MTQVSTPSAAPVPPAPPAAAPPSQPRLGLLGWLRFSWRQLTSMRTALVLLLLLALGAVPGSTFPQRSLDATRTARWIEDHPTAGPWLDRLGFFEVYASPWFSAIYLLLFISLIGCVIPRTRILLHQLRATPPRTPKRLERLPAHAVAEVDGEAQDVLEGARKALRAKRYRVHSHGPGTLSAEKGYAKEAGNLLFHLALIGVIVGVASGYLFGWRGDVILPVGQTFANTLIRYDTFSPGPWVDPSALAPYTLRLDEMEATFESRIQSKGQFGAARDFVASTTFTPADGSPSRAEEITVNGPLETGGGTVFLLGNGYAPKITVRDGSGTVVYSEATPFLTVDNLYKSTGAIKVQGRKGDLGFSGFFLPTGIIDDQGPRSVFPDALDPALALTVFEGRIFTSSAPQSVYSLDTTGLTQLTSAGGDPLRIWLKLGQTYELPGGRGSITFDSLDRYAGFSIRADPGKTLTLVSSLLSLAGLVASLVIRRRRVFVRVTDTGPRRLVTVGGLGQGDDDGITDELADVIARLAPEPAS